MLRLLPHIKSLAEKNNLPLIDLHEELLNLSEEELESLYLEDGLHPSDSGSFLIASMIAYVIGNRSYEEL